MVVLYLCGKIILEKKPELSGLTITPMQNWEKYGFQIFIGNQSDKKFWNSFKNKVGKVDIL